MSLLTCKPKQKTATRHQSSELENRASVSLLPTVSTHVQGFWVDLEEDMPRMDRGTAHKSRDAAQVAEGQVVAQSAKLRLLS